MGESQGETFAATGPPPRQHLAAATIGRSAGSHTQDERQKRRELAAQTAQQRQDSAVARGVGDPNKVKKMQDQNQREELMGRIAEYYAKLGEEVPMGLRLAEVSLLKRHLEQVQSQARRGQAAASMV
eukprot:CAMPEP_0197918236 /NCGR_PEP_ID=MMETSP1439-20131203/85108_1 /TAXON_ID=66791 /ORGANISM="Gonyaulax spinifera, Strain CCMP409" /LENGTH=126 /DNA_ID=CAMNT_0043540349 /DNA_START=23 /DNA_END=403 /DNA_ORIENTATION=-